MPEAPTLKTLPWRLLVLDVDGVLTDGKKIYDRDGRVFGKAYNDKDFTAIKRFQAAGVRVCLLSADRKVNEAMAEKRGLVFHYARHEDGTIQKAAWVDVLAAEYDVTPEQMAYVGDDFHDLQIIRRVGHSYCPSTAPGAVRRRVSKVLTRGGGDGLVAELYDMFEECEEQDEEQQQEQGQEEEKER